MVIIFLIITDFLTKNIIFFLTVEINFWEKNSLFRAKCNLYECAISVGLPTLNDTVLHLLFLLSNARDTWGQGSLKINKISVNFDPREVSKCDIR